MKPIRSLLCLLSAFALLPCLLLQAEQDISFTDAEEAYIEAQSAKAFSFVESALKSNPPSTETSQTRQLAMVAVDLIVHDRLMDRKPEIYNFIGQRIQLLADELEKPVAKGMRIFKLYNHSFIVKTPSVTMAFDLIRGGPSVNPFIPEPLMKRLVDQCDILFISHEHGDHADPKVGRMFTDAGKYVLAPPNLWDGGADTILRLRSPKVSDHSINLTQNRSLKVRIFPGHQSGKPRNTPNNIYNVTTPEGLSVMHTGDQYLRDDMDWLSKVKKTTECDVLLVNCWTWAPEIVIEGIAPKLVIPGHENELNHKVVKRGANWKTWERMKDIKAPIVFMLWGEHYDYTRN